MAVKDKGRKLLEKKNQALKQLKIEYVPLNAIRCNTYNPNRQSDHDFELLLKSIQEDGFTQPVICQPDGTIIDGEHRWTALIVLNYLTQQGLEWTWENIHWARKHRLEILDPAQEIPVVFADMTAEQMRIATLRHNRARGSEDVELTTQVLRELDQLGALDWAQDSLMMDDEEIQQLLENIPAPEALAEEEYSQAWEPTRLHENEIKHDSTSLRTLASSPSTGMLEVSAMSAKAIEEARERERRIQEAKTEEEKKMIQKDLRVYRLALIFSGDEADLIREVLGEHAAETLLQMCKEKIESTA